MIFTLIKNEIIKILKKPKTWIVFALFFLCVVGLAIVNNMSDKSYRYYDSPEGQIENLKQNKKYLENEIQSLKTEGTDSSRLNASQLEANLKEIDEKISSQEEILKLDEDEQWKYSLREEKKNLEESLKDAQVMEQGKDSMKARIKEIDEALDTNTKPVKSWEFNGINFFKSFMETIGIVILVLGIGIFMGDIVSGESTPPTLKFLLVQPISRGKVLLSKYISVSLVVITMICGMELVGFGAVGAIKGFEGAHEKETIGTRYELKYDEQTGKDEMKEVENSGHEVTRIKEVWMGFGYQILFILTCITFVFLMSTIFKSSMISMAVSLIISVISSMLCLMVPTLGKKIAHLLFFNYGNPFTVMDGSIVNGFNNVNFSAQFGIIIMVVTIVISYAISHIIFTKKDMLV